jgi:hypothetical protein
VLISKAALICGESSVNANLAISHAKAAAARQLMPQKVMHAQAALGSAMVRHLKTNDASTRAPKEETLAVLDTALENAKKMRLQKYAEMINDSKRMASMESFSK